MQFVDATGVERKEMKETSVNGQLPAELAMQLPDQRTRDAIGHPTRRQLLRGLRDSGRLSARDAADAGLVSCSLSCAAYHLGVLAKAGLAAETEAVRDGGTAMHYFTPSIDEGGAIPGVLQEMQRADQRLLADSAP
jgi:Helix-turn-helix domain